MALQFADLKAAYYDDADFLDGISSFSFACWLKINTLSVGSRQYPWGHKGVTNGISLRKDNGATEYWRFGVTCNGVTNTVDDTTGAVAQDVWYHIAGTWEPGSATGIAIYRNGALVDSNSTTAQSGTYDSGGSVDFYIGAQKNLTNYFKGSVEGLCIWTDTVLTANQILALYWVGWPHLAGCPRPDAIYALTEGTITRIPDSSGNGRHIESATIATSGVTAVATSGKWEAPDELPGGYYDQGSAGPGEPNPWTLFATVTHPTTSSTVTGLTNITAYEFVVSAVDTTGNESNYSDTVEATPQAVTTKHTSALKWIGH
jgi:hypothetical protein